MRFSAVILFALFAGVFHSPAADFYNIADPYMAEYEGFWSGKNGTKGRLTAQIRPLSNNQYEGYILFSRVKTPVTVFAVKPAPAENGAIKFAASSVKETGSDLIGDSQAAGELRDGKLSGTFNGELGDGTFEASRIERKSPSLGAKPPKHAIVLTQNDSTNVWQNLPWNLSKEGVLRVGKGNISAKDKLGNFRLHVEFRTPYLPIEQGQARGNSGVYLQGKYEVQVLDSFGIYPLRDNDCGGVYKVKAPIGQACLPPMQWQTFDIIYVDGAGARPPRVTIDHNGVRVIERAEIPPEFVTQGTGGGNSESGFLMLQDHGSPVEFRNIWALPFFSAERSR